MKNNVLKFYIAAVYFFSTLVLFAQPSSNDTGGTLEGTDAPAAPIDNYLWVLAGIGLLFVFMKFKSMYNTKIQG